jgi:hypothetical protein
LPEEGRPSGRPFPFWGDRGCASAAGDPSSCTCSEARPASSSRSRCLAAMNLGIGPPLTGARSGPTPARQSRRGRPGGMVSCVNVRQRDRSAARRAAREGGDAALKSVARMLADVARVTARARRPLTRFCGLVRRPPDAAFCAPPRVLSKSFPRKLQRGIRRVRPHGAFVRPTEKSGKARMKTGPILNHGIRFRARTCGGRRPTRRRACPADALAKPLTLA